MRQTGLLLLGVVWLLLLPSCRQNGGTMETTPAPAVRSTTASGLETLTWVDPLGDCAAGLTPVDCVVGRDLERVQVTVGDASIIFELTLSDGHWLGEQAHLTYLLFDLDKDSATGDTDYAPQYGVGPEVSVVVGWQNQRLNLNVYRHNDISSLPRANVEVIEERTLRVQVPIRILGATEFDFAAFVLGADAVRDDFPNNSKIRFPGGEMVDRGE